MHTFVLKKKNNFFTGSSKLQDDFEKFTYDRKSVCQLANKKNKLMSRRIFTLQN